VLCQSAGQNGPTKDGRNLGIVQLLAGLVLKQQLGPARWSRS
jgi:hypothetical protein